VLISLPIVGSSSPASAAVSRIRVISNAFIPYDLTISVGDTVRWRNATADTTHTTTSKTGLWDERLTTHDSFSRRFPEQGVFRYRCTLHRRMTAKIVVH
jgi:plastocyanin